MDIGDPAVEGPKLVVGHLERLFVVGKQEVNRKASLGEDYLCESRLDDIRIGPVDPKIITYEVESGLGERGGRTRGDLPDETRGNSVLGERRKAAPSRKNG